jgi:hypothetical protein
LEEREGLLNHEDAKKAKDAKKTLSEPQIFADYWITQIVV